MICVAWLLLGGVLAQTYYDGEGEPQSTDVGGVQVLQDNTWGGYDYGYGHWGQIGCEDRGLLSIRSKTICKLAFQALGVGTTFQGHEDAKLLGGGHIYPDVPNQPKGCFISVYWSDYEFDYHYNPINETEVSRVAGNFDYAYKSVCLVPPLRNECNATECEEDTVMSGQQCTPVCPPGQVPTHKSLFCVEGNLSPPAYSCVPEREPEGSECEDLENSTFDCLNVTVRGTACQRWDFDSPFNIAERNNSERPPHNFCRRSTLTWRRFPMKATGPDRSWCFTTADGMSWDYCVPQCVEGPWRDRDTVIDPTQQALAWTCRDYTAKQLCTEEGYGAKWGSYITRTGAFDDYRYLGLSAREACCACGGGKRSERCEDNPLFEDQFGKCGIRGIHKGGCNHIARFYCPRACGLCKVPEPAADKLLQTCEDFELDFRSCLFYTSSSDTAEDVCSDVTLERRFRDHLGDEAPASFGNAFEKFRSVCPFSCRLCHKCKPGFLLNTQPIANASDRLAYQCVACQPGQFSPSPDGIRCLDCEPGRSAAMPGRSKCETCRPGYSSSSGASLCDPCSAGFIPNLMRTRCDACPSGSFAESNASNSCELCPEGSFAPAVGSSECSLCSPGRYSAQGSSRCVECPAGFAAPKVGAQACDWCQKDTYTSAAGSSSCLRCGLGTITVDRGTTSVGDCVCPAGTCFDPEQQYCTPCLEGMVCDVGCNYSSFNDAAGVFPRLLPGYMTRLSEPLRVFRCRAELHCPGGEPASCAAGRDSAQVACGLCALGFSPSGQNCNPCQEQDVWPFALGCVGGLLVAIFATLSLNKDPLLRSNSNIMVAILAGMTVSCFQTLNVFAQLDIPWFEPVGSILQALSAFSFNLELLSTACVIGTSPVRSYAAQLLILPAILPVVFVTLLLKKRFSKTQVRTEFCNTAGTLFQVLFITVLLSCVSPLQCFDHPSGGSSLHSMPAVLCLEGEHYFLLLLGSVAFISLPCPFWAASLWATWVYPAKLLDKSDRGRLFVFGTQFLFSRFRPAAHYYGIFTLAKSFLLTLSPVCFQTGGALQSCYLCIILVLFLMHQQQVLPWKSRLANQLDGACSLSLIVLLLCGALASSPDESTRAQLQFVGTAVFVVLATLIAAALIYAGFRVIVPGKKYKWFICHHKADASAQARLLKVLLKARSSHETFIDSDNLVDLDTLFDVVRCQLDTLVVFMTRDVLTRPWCAGEIVTAFRTGKVKVLTVKTSSFVAPTDEQMDDLTSYLDLSSCDLSRFAIQADDVRHAFERLLGGNTPMIEFGAYPVGTSKFDRLADKIVSLTLNKRLGKQKEREEREMHAGTYEDCVVISSEPGRDEATAAVSILSAKMHGLVAANNTSIVCLVDLGQSEFQMLHYVAKCRALVVILSNGSMTSILQLHTIVEMMLQLEQLGSSKAKPAIIPVNLPDFQFPQGHFYENQLPDIWDLTLQSVEDAEAHIRSFFRFIAISFPIHASDILLQTQAADVVRRVPAESMASSAAGREPLLQDLANIVSSSRGRRRRSQEDGLKCEDIFINNLDEEEELAREVARSLRCELSDQLIGLPKASIQSETSETYLSL